MRHILFLCALILSFPAWAITHPNEKLTDPTLEARALALTQNLRCVVCQNESIEESHADIARDLRILVRTQILAGKSDAEITNFLRARYGDYILLNPPLKPSTGPLWLMPYVLLLGGSFAAYISFRKRRHR